LGLLLSAEPLRFLGKISYGLYLWHLPLIVFFGARWHLSGWQVLFPLACALVLATISYVTVEAWARRLKQGLKRKGPRAAIGVEIGYAPQGAPPTPG
jgi:peptidoglycan/LPS O-acetylase OafA/YrhL